MTPARTLDHPREGYWLVRAGKGFPLCPARIVWLETRHEPGCVENDMSGTRSRHLAAFVSGQPVAMEQVWHRRGEPLSRAAYDAMMAQIADARRADKYLPMAAPFTKVAVAQMKVPFL